jgi:phage-related protein
MEDKDKPKLILGVNFYKSESGTEPVRDWLKSMNKEEKKIIGEDIKTVQYGWPLGMPIVKKIEKGLWEIRSNLENTIARIFFTIIADRIILLHGFIKKTMKIPKEDLEIARNRKKRIN